MLFLFFNTCVGPVANANVAATLNGISYQQAPSPPISQLNDMPPSQFCDGNRDNCTNCVCTHMLRIPLNATVEIILVDTCEYSQMDCRNIKETNSFSSFIKIEMFRKDCFRSKDIFLIKLFIIAAQVTRITHPFHMHGYAFRVLSMDQPLGPYSSTGNSTTIDVNFVKQLDRRGKIRRNFNAASKDTLAVPNNGYTVIRFRANNPGTRGERASFADREFCTVIEIYYT